MTLTLRHVHLADECCGLCGGKTPNAAGPALCVGDSGVAVCKSCGRKHAPTLAALVDLAGVARRVGRIGRHTLVPPMTALLDLARVAEHYAHAEDERRAAAPPREEGE